MLPGSLFNRRPWDSLLLVDGRHASCVREAGAATAAGFRIWRAMSVPAKDDEILAPAAPTTASPAACRSPLLLLAP